MKKHTKLKKYSELFKKNIKQFLSPGISIKTKIYPVEAEGAVFEFLLNKESDQSEILEKIRPTVGRVLAEIPQRMIGGNIEGVRFGGTNLYLEGNRVIVIKGEDSFENWTNKAIENDVKRVVSTSQGSKAS
jgi:hypothetical protein